MEYNLQKHGPPYLPEVSEAQRREARILVQKNAAYYDVDVPQENVYAPLALLLSFQRALYMVHQTHHWQTRGGHYYADHLLFQRIYEESAEYVDGTAERLIGLSGDPGFVSIGSQIGLIHKLIDGIYEGKPEVAPQPENLVDISLMGELIFLSTLREIKESIESQGGMTDGLEDLIQGTASKHEEFVYLLKQRSAYTYDRR